MIRDIVTTVLLNIAKQYPLSDGRGVNMFSFIEDTNVLLTDTFDKIHIDYLAGKFWSRNWEQEGADPSTMRREYPFVTLENTTVTKDWSGSKCECFEFWVMIGDVVQPRDCQQKSEVDVFSSLYALASNVISELNDTYEYVNGSEKIYASKKYVDYYQNKGELLGYRKIKRLVTEFDDFLKITANDLNNGDGAKAVTFKFTVCGKMPVVEFNYEEIEPSKLIGLAICDVC